MKVFITGGTGFIGGTLAARFLEDGHEVTVLTRSVDREKTDASSVVLVEGDPTRRGSWQERVSDCQVIINLAGASIFRRWTEKAKKLILESRVLTTRNLVEALSGRKGKETVLLSNSAVGYYGFRDDEEIDETSPAGDDFLATVTRQWESSAFEAEKLGVRVLVCRLGIVLGRNGGALAEMTPLFRKGLGSPIGSGRQWFSWIHEKDLAETYLFLISRGDLEGPVNLTSPNPVRNKDLTKALCEAMGKPCLLPPVPGFVIRLLKGEFGSVLLKGQRVMPSRLDKEGFSFGFADIRTALKDLTVP